MLRRFWRYSEQRFALTSLFASIADPRQHPRIAMRVIVVSLFLVTFCRLRSLNGLQQRRGCGWFRSGIPSADTVGRVACEWDVEQTRRIMYDVYGRLKRGKSLRSTFHQSLMSVVLDGHECCASFHRHCKHCLQRKVRTQNGERVQYYHRIVCAALLSERFVLLLDVEMQQPGEGEVACAMRLFARLMESYPQAFDIVCADGLYAQKPFIKMVRKHRKHCVVVLKDERRDLMKEAQSAFARICPRLLNFGKKQRQVWDAVIEARWAQTAISIRVVRSVELSYVRRQATAQKEALSSEWIWATTMSEKYLPTEALVTVGHQRWHIENNCFNEMVHTWNADHVYVHDVKAILAFWLMTMLAYNLFHAFFMCNLKPQLRRGLSKRYLAEQITAQLDTIDESGIILLPW